MIKRFLSSAYLYIILCLLYAPILLIIVFSFFNTSDFSFANGFSFESYAQIFNSEKTPALLDALKNTVYIAVISSVISTILGTVASIGMHYLPKRVKKLSEGINQLPVINSEVVMAVSFMVFFVTFAFPEGYVRLIIAHVAFCTPYVVLSVMPRLAQMDSNIYEAAQDLGASPIKAMRKVLLPYLAPAIVSGFVMAFTLSLDDFIITQINKGASTGIETLSTLIYSDARVQGLEPFWFAVFSIIFVVVLTVLLIVNLKKSTKVEEKKII